MTQRSDRSSGGCPSCGHDLMEHGPIGCTHRLHRRDPDDLAFGHEVCSCRRGRHDALGDDVAAGSDGWPMTVPDRELAATLHVLDAPTLRSRVEKHIDIEQRGIDFEAMLEVPWSSGERALVEIACSMWGRQDIADGRLSDVLHRIDRECFERVIEAIHLRRGNA